MNIIQNLILRRIVFALGLMSLLLGFMGVFLPLLPTTPFLLFSAWAFLQSSPQAHQWLFNHPHLGPILQRWYERGAISKPTKVIAILMLVTSVITMWFKIETLLIKAPLIFFLVAIGIFIASRPHN